MKIKKDRSISATEVAKKFNITYHAVNHYTNLGLLTSRERKGNNRYYLESEVNTRLKKINKLKNEGYPLSVMRKIILP